MILVIILTVCKIDCLQEVLNLLKKNQQPRRVAEVHF
jgi:hypothetical protein